MLAARLLLADRLRQLFFAEGAYLGPELIE
jgi:hypothetical protein